MKAILHFEVLADDGSLETDSTITWAKCDWGDITALQDVLVQALDRTIELGYTLALENKLVTSDQVGIARAIAKGAGRPSDLPPQAKK
jgi:ABC-type proline/glycine betaine transport system substrate-binding protein